MHEFSRTALLFDEVEMKKIKNATIAVFGVGGVGGNCIEALVRSGIKEVSIYDNDVVSITNINRQVVALHSTIGKEKVKVMKERLLDINPNVIVNEYPIFIDNNSIHSIDFTKFDYVIDAIDTISAKLLLIEHCIKDKIEIISCMGTGNKLNPTQLEIMDISKTKYCPLAKVMRKELKDREIYKLKVLSTHETPLKPSLSDETGNKRQIPGSTSFVPSVAGIIIASEVIKDIIKR